MPLMAARGTAPHLWLRKSLLVMLLGIAGLVSCNQSPEAKMSQASDSMNSGAEIGQAISFFESSPAIVRRSPWVFKGREGAIIHFMRELEIIAEIRT